MRASLLNLLQNLPPKLGLLLATATIFGVACQKSGFRRPTVGGTPAGVVDVQIVTRNDVTAKPQSLGKGTLRVTSPLPMVVNCIDCPPGLGISFASTGSGLATNNLTSSLNHPFVTATKVCRIRLNVRYPDLGRTEEISYGLYFCPIVGGVKRCETSRADNLCP